VSYFEFIRHTNPSQKNYQLLNESRENTKVILFAM